MPDETFEERLEKLEQRVAILQRGSGNAQIVVGLRDAIVEIEDKQRQLAHALKSLATAMRENGQEKIVDQAMILYRQRDQG